MNRNVIGLLAAAAALLLMLICCGEPAAGSQPTGVDVSQFDGNVNWAQVKANGVSFAYIKATEGISVRSQAFTQQYTGASIAGLIRGAYHFGQPAASTGAVQAAFFLAQGGFWSQDGKTLPGALDIEDNPNGDACYGLSKAEMGAWLADFVATYQARTLVYPVIYTTNSWFLQCVDPAAAGQVLASCPLWIASYSTSAAPLPPPWTSFTFWQYAASGAANPGGQDSFNGDDSDLQKLVRGA